MNGRKGFSLVEAMVAMGVMLLVMSAIYMMILYYRDVSGTEQARVSQTQESRYLMSVFSSELKNAGSVLTLVNSGGFLSSTPYFNGIYPLNNTTFPDGVVVASGDPDAVCKLTDEIDLTTSSSLAVTSIANWAPNDKGILIGPDGCYVFSVESIGVASLNMAATPVYYSGLLNTAHYDDPETTMGNGLTYPANAPVIRLDSFSIYLINERLDAAKGRNVRELVRVSDCKGIPGVLENNDPVNGPVKGVIAENVWDLQLVYTAYPDFPSVLNKVDYFNGGAGTLADLLTAIRVKSFKELTVSVVVLTDDYPGKGEITYPLTLLADRAATSLPPGKFNYKTYSFQVEPRNYNIKL